MATAYSDRLADLASDRDDRIHSQLDTAIITHALATLAYALGEDTAGDAAHDQIADAMANDGIDTDDELAAMDLLNRWCPDARAALRVIGDELQRIARAEAVKRLAQVVA